MSNHLKFEKQRAVISNLVEGSSIRATERLTSVHRDTICRLALRVGQGCARLHDRLVLKIPARLIQLDEIWGFVGKKQKRTQPGEGTGDWYTFVALDVETKLVISYLTDRRDSDATVAFVDDLHGRIIGRPQISSDGWEPYAEAIMASFGPRNVDYGQLVKRYEAHRHHVNITKVRIFGNPVEDLITTSHVERQNLTMRMMIRRLTRLTNAFSKKVDSLKAAVSLHFAYYNFCRPHTTIRVTPAMESGLTNTIWSVSDLLHEVGIQDSTKSCAEVSSSV